MLNATKVATATTDAAGDATLPLDLRGNNAGKTEIDANIFIDACDQLHRVIVAERGQPIAAQQPGCERREISGLYWVRRVNTLVVDVGGPNPTMMLIKGEYGLEPERTWGVPAGLVVFGGGGLTKFRDAALILCGTASSCGKDTGFAYTAGATLWLKRYVGVEGSYLKPRKTTAAGSGGTTVAGLAELERRHGVARQMALRVREEGGAVVRRADGVVVGDADPEAGLGGTRQRKSCAGESKGDGKPLHPSSSLGGWQTQPIPRRRGG